MSPFDFINSINDSKVDLMVDDLAEREYNSYMVNRGLSYFVDTVLHANEMNRLYFLDARLQYLFLLNSIRKKKRFSKWFKPQAVDAITIVQAYYDCSIEKAKVAAAILTSAQIEELKKRLYTGGRAAQRR